MPRYRNRSKPWMASVNSPEGKNVYLGYYATWDEARCVELDHGGKLYVRNPTTTNTNPPPGGTMYPRVRHSAEPQTIGDISDED